MEQQVRSAIEVSESFKTNLFKILDPTEDNTFANMINGVGFRDIYDSVVGKDWRPGKKLGIVSGLEKTAQEVADTLGPLTSPWYPGEKEVEVGKEIVSLPSSMALTTICLTTSGTYSLCG